MKTISLILTVILSSILSFSQSSNTEIDNNKDVFSDNPLIVKTKYGYIKGKKDKNNTTAWKGIPYAKPPVNNLRWKAPIEPEPWEGVLSTRKFSNPALQYHPVIKRRIYGSEDCLYLNIWKPSTGKSKLPVYVWIHGGGNTIGYANQLPEYYGHVIAEKSEVIFVSVNYRLGPFGWLTHPALRNSEDPADNSGNFGTLDIIQSLKWIKENIHAFGGDPEKIMITGESAGGINILSLLISPRAKGLFSSALIQSGLPKIGKIKESEELTEKIILKLLIKNKIVDNIQEAKKKLSETDNNEIREFLYKQKGKDIMKTLSPYLLGMINMPFIFPDGYVIPKNGYDVLETGENVNKVPLIIGCNTDEMKLFLYFSKKPHWKDSVYNTIAKYGSNMWKAVGVDQIAEKLSNIPDHPPVYVYLFNWGHPDDDQKSSLSGNWGDKLGTHHMLEIKFFLGTDKRFFSVLSMTNSNKYRKGRQALSDVMMTYTKNFIHNGNPNNNKDNLQNWKAWSEDNNLKGIIFDADKTNAVIKKFNYKLHPEDILKEMKEKLSKEEIDKADKFLFIFY